MAITDYAAWESRLLNPRQWGTEPKSMTAAVNGTRGRMISMFQEAPDAGSAPSTAAAVSSATAGTVGQEDGGGNPLRIPGLWVNGEKGTYMLCDRLSHQGGLSATVTTPQTTNLPTAALTRYTSGVGVMAALEIYTQIGATGTTVAISYTDQDGNAGQVSPLVAFGNTGFREAMRMIQIPLAVGDTGVRSVESVTVTATTGTAGNFGVTLFKPLLYLPIGGHDPMIADPILGTLNSLPEILDGAGLFWVRFPFNVATSRFLTHVPYAED